MVYVAGGLAGGPPPRSDAEPVLQNGPSGSSRAPGPHGPGQPGADGKYCDPMRFRPSGLADRPGVSMAPAAILQNGFRVRVDFGGRRSTYQ